MRISFFGSSLLSAYWNGAATYYRGLLKALHARGASIHFFEPDAYGRQENRDIDQPTYAQTTVYPPTSDGWRRALDAAVDCDLLVKASDVGIFDAELGAAVSALTRPARRTVFWDVNAPATLERLATEPDDPLADLVPRFDLIVCHGGGPKVDSAYRLLGARDVLLVHSGLDPSTHHRTASELRFFADVSFLGDRLPDREARMEEFFFKPTRLLPQITFSLGGEGWQGRPLPQNVTRHGHVPAPLHNSFHCSSTISLHVTRESMARFGHAPASRIFEVAGAACCLISDRWEGIEYFFEPGREILMAANGEEMAETIMRLTPGKAREIGEAARQRALAEHTYARRADQFLGRIA